MTQTQIAWEEMVHVLSVKVYFSPDSWPKSPTKGCERISCSVRHEKWSQKEFAQTFSKTITISAKEKLSTPGNCRCPAEVSTVCDTCDSMSCDPPTIQRRLGISTPLKDIWPPGLYGIWMVAKWHLHMESRHFWPLQNTLNYGPCERFWAPICTRTKMTPEMMLAPHILNLSFFQGGY